MTDAERQRRRYARQKAGLVRVEAWVPAHAEEAVRAAIEALVQRLIDDKREAVEAAKGETDDDE